MPAVLEHKRNVVSEGIGIVFVNPVLYGPKDRNLKPIKYHNAKERGAQYFDLFKNDLKLNTSFKLDPTIQDVEQWYKEANEISLRFREKHFISDETKVGGKTWNERKSDAMKEDYTK